MKTNKRTQTKSKLRNTKHKEIEYKYDASKVTLAQFNQAVFALKPKSSQTVGGWDYYYSNENGFFRHRLDKENPELTSKRRINKGSAANRDEVNIYIARGTTAYDMGRIMQCAGVPFDFAIYKTNTIHFFKEVDICFYTVFNKRRKKIGQFIEIEFMTKIKGKSVSYKLKQIRKYEQLLSCLGLSPATRMNKTLFEIYTNNGKKK